MSEQKLSELQSEIDRLNNVVTELGNEVEYLKSNITNLEEEIGELTDEVEELEKRGQNIKTGREGGINYHADNLLDQEIMEAVSELMEKYNNVELLRTLQQLFKIGL
jgi:predicted RNase H-like nuclease (RuvC/YqgF family)